MDAAPERRDAPHVVGARGLMRNREYDSMKPSTFALLGAATLGLAACGGPKDTGNAAADAANDSVALNTTAAAIPGPAQAFANTAAASDAFEIAASQLALEKSGSANVKKFATHMIAAHTESAGKLKAAAATASPALTPDATLTAGQQAKLDSLRAASGGAFDTAYIAEQRAAHDAALAALRDYAANGDAAPLKALAAELVPVVAAHVNMAKSLKP
jgi:putative membrane protein